MDKLTNPKQVLNTWCSKKKLKIDYQIDICGKNDLKLTPLFQCKIKIQSINPEIACRNGTNKKIAADLAALDALNYLIVNNYLKSNELASIILKQIDQLINKNENPFSNDNKASTTATTATPTTNSNSNTTTNTPTTTSSNNTTNNSNSSNKNDSKSTKNVSRFYMDDDNQLSPLLEKQKQQQQQQQQQQRLLQSNNDNNYQQTRPPIPDHWNSEPSPSSSRGKGPRFPPPPPQERFNYPPPNHFDGPPPDHFNYPPLNDFDGPPPPGHFNHPPPFFDGPPGPPPPPHHHPDHFDGPPPHPNFYHGPPPHPEFFDGPPPPDFYHGPPGPPPHHPDYFDDGPPPHHPDFYRGPPPHHPDFFDNGPPPPDFYRGPPGPPPPNFPYGPNYHFNQPPPPPENWRRSRNSFRNRKKSRKNKKNSNDNNNNENNNNNDSNNDKSSSSKSNNNNEIKDSENTVVDNQLKNLNINETTASTTSNEEESVINLLKEAKKRKFDPSSVRDRLNLIEQELKFNLENSKQLLNNFFQLHKINTEYEIDSYGPPHLKTFVSKLKFYCYRNRKEYFAEEKGQSKIDASRYCALNILEQLYKDNLIDSFEPDALSRRQLLKMSLVYVLEIKSELKNLLVETFNYLQSYNAYAQQLKLINPQFNSLTSTTTGLDLNQSKESNNFLYWCPPLENFNPWTNSNLDGTIFSGKTKQDVNLLLQNEFTTMIKSQKFQQVLSVRMKLPIWEHKEKVISLIRDNPVAVIKGSTGCGKTTQVSQFILDSYIKSGNGSNCNIIVTQPRRISAISIAERVAFERGEIMKEGKSSVGYAVRFDQIYPRPYGSILFCTTGHLLRRIQGGLKGVSHLIIDEVHERDINTDLLLIIIRDLIKLDLNIHVVIMSATLGVTHFQKYFDCREAFEIDSHLFPVNEYFLEDTIEMIKWHPEKLSYLEDDVELSEVPVSINNSGLNNFDYPEKISEKTRDILKRLKEGVICFELIVALLEYIHSLTITGSILIFLPGWSAIFALLNYLKRHRIFGNENKFLILPLHSQLSHKDNNRIFQYSTQRKIILSTNIAETSITIDDVIFVIDTCLIKRKHYCSKTNVTSFEVDWVSKSNIKQRKGRAGRVRSGYFFILCTRQRYESLEEFKKPEILISSLVETTLLIKYLGFGSVPDFLQRALDPPNPHSVDEALKTLNSINALDDKYELTPLGTILAKMPIDPKIGRMVIQSILFNVAGPVTTIAAASSINFEMFDNQDLNLLLETLYQLDEERFSDHLIVFKVFNLCEEQKNPKNRFGTNNYNNNYQDYGCINLNAVNVVRNARKQLVGILTKCGFNSELFDLKQTNQYSEMELDIISGLLVTAFYPNVCIHKETRRILTNEERIGLIHKTSVFYSYLQNQKLPRSKKLKSPLFIYSEKSQTNKLISSKQMTLISFLHVLLFGMKNFQFPPIPPTPSTTTAEQSQNLDLLSGTILIDGWIEIKIDAAVFESLWQLKTEFEQILIKICSEPNFKRSEFDLTVLNSIGQSCLFDNISVEIVSKPV